MTNIVDFPHPWPPRISLDDLRRDVAFIGDLMDHGLLPPRDEKIVQAAVRVIQSDSANGTDLAYSAAVLNLIARGG